MAEPQLELDELDPAGTGESLRDVQTDSKPEIEEVLASDGGGGGARVQRRVRIDPQAGGATDIEFEEGWAAEGGRAGRKDEERQRESAFLEDEAYGRVFLDTAPPQGNAAKDRRIEHDSPEGPCISLCQVKLKLFRYIRYSSYYLVDYILTIIFAYR